MLLATLIVGACDDGTTPLPPHVRAPGEYVERGFQPANEVTFRYAKKPAGLLPIGGSLWKPVGPAAIRNGQTENVTPENGVAGGYLVPRADGRILAGSTTEHNGFEKAGSDSAVRGLQEMAFEIAPGLGGLSMMDNWCGLRPASTDGLPILGTVGGIVGPTVLTAHYRNGILLAPITAQIAADRILNGNDHWAFTEFSAARFSISAAVV